VLSLAHFLLFRQVKFLFTLRKFRLVEIKFDVAVVILIILIHRICLGHIFNVFSLQNEKQIKVTNLSLQRIPGEFIAHST